MTDWARRHTVSVEALQLANEFIWMLEDTASIICGRALAAMQRYYQELFPPFTSALMKYTATEEHSSAAPGHQGGVAFTKSPIGCFFHDYYGENLFRTDTGIERIELGSLLDHTGPIGEAEVLQPASLVRIAATRWLTAPPARTAPSWPRVSARENLHSVTV